MAGDALMSDVGDEGFEEPTLTEIGSVHELTLQNKTTGAADGVTFNGIPIGPTSV